ncbi:YciI family protein [Amycolatopsis albispora]|uniref:Transcription initiation protein n=1 Tax=Amycolatopsis albispora TaxID=1804986 RepID=A0A344L8M0_9PSEU|nr:YciI family protein [Amycolatopsis albispora]AXB44394.1 transcription initiation protein [Amycolatopsis albispora]
MRYLLMIGGEEGSEAEKLEGCGGWTERMERRGVLRSGVALRPPDEAVTVRVRGDEVLRSDGPFAETKEQIGGFCVIECADLDEAVEIAADHPVAELGLIEIRPLVDS